MATEFQQINRGKPWETKGLGIDILRYKNAVGTGNNFNQMEAFYSLGWTNRKILCYFKMVQNKSQVIIGR